MELYLLWIHHSLDGGWTGNKNPIRGTVGGTRWESQQQTLWHVHAGARHTPSSEQLSTLTGVLGLGLVWRFRSIFSSVSLTGEESWGQSRRGRGRDSTLDRSPHPLTRQFAACDQLILLSCVAQLCLLQTLLQPRQGSAFVMNLFSLSEVTKILIQFGRLCQNALNSRF